MEAIEPTDFSTEQRSHRRKRIRSPGDSPIRRGRALRASNSVRAERGSVDFVGFVASMKRPLDVKLHLNLRCGNVRIRSLDLHISTTRVSLPCQRHETVSVAVGA